MTEVQNTTVKNALDRLAALDEDGFLDAFAASGFVDDWGSIYRGRDEIDAWSRRELVGALGVLTITSVDEGGAAADPSQALVVVTGDWRSSFANGPSRFEFLVVDGAIASMTIRAA